MFENCYFYLGEFAVSNAIWHESGEKILLMSKDKMCLCDLNESSLAE